MAWGGHPQGAPLPIVFSRRYALGRAPTRGAPTDCLLSALWPGEGTHKGCPYRLFSLGVMAGEGRPQGAPLPIVFSRRYGRGRAPTRGAPTVGWGVPARGRAPTRGAPTVGWEVPARGGTHKGRPYGWIGGAREGGHPQGAPLRLDRRCPRGGGHPQGAPLRLDRGAREGEGTHKGRAPLPDSGSLTWFFLI